MTANQDSGASGGFIDPDKAAWVKDMAKFAGAGFVQKQVVGMVQNVTVEVLTENGPEDLRNKIIVGYPLIENDLPPNMRRVVSGYGQEFEAEIREVVRPENIMDWMEDPEWLPEDAEEEREDLREAARVIRETPGGAAWLYDQCYALYEIAGIE